MSYGQRGGRSDKIVLLKNLSLMASSGFFLAALLILAGLLRSGNQFFSELAQVFNKPQPAPQVDVRSVVVQQIRGASELTTAVFTMEAVVPTSQERAMNGFVIGTTKLLYIAYGEVRAGVDLGALKPENVEVVGETIRVQLPAPRILDSKIDVSRSSVYDYDRGFLGLGPDVAPNLQQLAEQNALQKIVAAACAQGVLQKANDRAQFVVTQFLQTAGYAQVKVEAQLPDPRTCPSPTAG